MDMQAGAGGVHVDDTSIEHIVASTELGAPPVGAPRRGNRRLKHALVAVDVTAAFLAWGTTLWALAPFGATVTNVPLAAALGAATVAVARSQHLYLARFCAVQTAEMAGLLRVVGVIAVMCAGLVHALEGRHPIATAATGAVISAIALVLGRAAYRSFLAEARRQGRFVRRVLVIGTAQEALDIAALMADHNELGYEVLGFLATASSGSAEDAIVPVLGSVDELVRVADGHGATGIIVAASAISAAECAAAVRGALAVGLHVQLSNGCPNVDRRRLVPHHLMHTPFLYVEPVYRGPLQLATKRVLDIVVATALLVVTAPVWLAVAVAIKTHDGGPVFFRQERVGYGQRRFRVIKFRTMAPDAEARLAQLAARNMRRGGPLFKAPDDPRVTPVGRFLRLTSIDELPQLVNVLRGEMSIVGPRPPLPAEAEHFDADLMRRFEVRPGLTGLWQLHARDNAAFSAYRRLDLHYVENWSIALDVAIIAATAWELLVRPLVRRSRADSARARLRIVPSSEATSG